MSPAGSRPEPLRSATDGSASCSPRHRCKLTFAQVKAVIGHDGRYDGALPHS